MPAPHRYRLYIDEAGDHTRSRSATDPVGRRYMCLLGVMVPMGEEYIRLQASVEEVKRAHLPYDPDVPPILHREDILHRRGPFRVLNDDTTRAAFDDALIELIHAAPITVFASSSTSSVTVAGRTAIDRRLPLLPHCHA